MTRLEAMREDGAYIDNQALPANIAETVELAREHGRRQTDHDNPVHLDLAEP